MNTKTLILCLMLSAVSRNCAVGESQNDNKSNPNSENSIVFNGWYHSGKEKWQGTIHNKMLFTWFTAVTTASSEAEYKKLVSYQRQNGVKYIGYYYSSTTSAPQKPLEYPEGTIPNDAIKPSWVVRDRAGTPVTWPGQEHRFYLDVGIRQVQEAILERAIKNAKSLGANVLFLDNWSYKSFAPGNLQEQQWAQKCLSLLIRARELSMQNNIKLVVNLSSPVESWVEFATYLDGIAYEMAAHPNRLKTRDLYELELSSYEKVLAMGKSIFLYTDTLTHNGRRWDEDGRKVAATAMLVMPEVQPYWGGIYVANPRYEVWPVGGWALWPEQLGKPSGPRKWEGNTVTRNFEHGSIAVTAGDQPKFSVTINY